jgi:hypothetical protein
VTKGRNILPGDAIVPTEKLAACFNNTSATYKFYWFLSLLHFAEKGKMLVSKREMFACMVSKAWYTINYFHISFGAQDKLQRAIERIRLLEGLSVDANQNEIFCVLSETKNTETIRELMYFDKQVPHWFLSPWFPNANKQEIYKRSGEFRNFSPYTLSNDYIDISLLWSNYFQKNIVVIRDFCYWNLASFLQQKNPNVPDIPGKLVKPAKRPGLSSQRSYFWNPVLEELGKIRCIYTGKTLNKTGYAIEHFVPYSFVSHDLIWNLIPADQSFNSSKGDKLPPMEKYFDSFFKIQTKAVQAMKHLNPNNKFLQDYLTIFPDLDIIESAGAKERFRETIQPLITIAHNNGFEFMNNH